MTNKKFLALFLALIAVVSLFSAVSLADFVGSNQVGEDPNTDIATDEELVDDMTELADALQAAAEAALAAGDGQSTTVDNAALQALYSKILDSVETGRTTAAVVSGTVITVAKEVVITVDETKENKEEQVLSFTTQNGNSTGLNATYDAASIKNMKEFANNKTTDANGVEKDNYFAVELDGFETISLDATLFSLLPDDAVVTFTITVDENGEPVFVALVNGQPVAGFAVKLTAKVAEPVAPAAAA